MKYQFQAISVLIVAGISFSTPAEASRCLKQAEKQALSMLKKAGHSDTVKTKNTKLVKPDDEAKRVYSLKPSQELFSTEIWEDENNYAIYDVLVETEDCRLKMVRAGGI